MSHFFSEYLELLRNPAHLAVEITMMILLDVVILGLLWPLVRRLINHKIDLAHKNLDVEHGITHHDDHIHVDPAPKDC